MKNSPGRKKTRWIGCFFQTATQLWHKTILLLGNNIYRKTFYLSSRRIHVISRQLKKFLVNSFKENKCLEILQDKSVSDEEWSNFIKLYTVYSSLQKEHRERKEKRGKKKECAWGRGGQGETEGFLIMNQNVIPNIN